MSTASTAAEIQKQIGRLKSGTLRFWGVWFGRPYDNCHRIVRADAVEDCLHLSFDQQESLQVWRPIGCSFSSDTFLIRQAERVRWEWFYYGRSRTPENLCFHDLIRENGKVLLSTNVDWYVEEQQPDGAASAVQMY